MNEKEIRSIISYLRKELNKLRKTEEELCQMTGAQLYQRLTDQDSLNADLELAKKLMRLEQHRKKAVK